MKKLIYLLFVIVLTGCGYSTPILNDSREPFVVSKILPFNKSHVKYIGNMQKSSLTFTPESVSTAIIAPVGMYNIGDTISLK